MKLGHVLIWSNQAFGPSQSHVWPSRHNFHYRLHPYCHSHRFWLHSKLATTLHRSSDSRVRYGSKGIDCTDSSCRERSSYNQRCSRNDMAVRLCSHPFKRRQVLISYFATDSGLRSAFVGPFLDNVLLSSLTNRFQQSWVTLPTWSVLNSAA
jgi:hypothetical protein